MVKAVSEAVEVLRSGFDLPDRREARALLDELSC
jgi:hypothetical protein